MAELSKESPESTHSNITNKNDFSSLVFSFEGYFHALAEIETKNDFEILKEDTVQWVICNKDSAPFEKTHVFVARTNPTKPTFFIEKSKSKGNDNININIKFESLRGFTNFIISGDENGVYCAIVLTPSKYSKTLLIILSFPDQEIIHKIIRNIIFCRDDYIRTSSIALPNIIVDNDLFIYSGVDIIVKPEIYEIGSSGEMASTPRENQTFKLRRNLPKTIELAFIPLRSFELSIEKCFGALYSINGNDPSKMRPFDDFTFEMFTDTSEELREGYRLIVKVLPSSTAYDIFVPPEDDIPNSPPRDSIRILCGIDIIVKNIISPIRLLVELSVKMFNENEKFWIKGRGKIQKNFKLILRRNFNDAGYEMSFVKFEQFDDKAKKRIEELDAISKYRYDSSTEQTEEGSEGSPSQDIVLSGTFQFQPDIPPNIVSEWSSVIINWQETEEIPMNLQRLLKYGIPSEHRQVVWPMLVGLYHGKHISQENYDELVSRDSEFERVIQRDITRTFTCHQYFKHSDSEGQQLLYRVCKAYSNHDQEVGYCQGMSFIIANFLLHFDELTAFSVLEKVMFQLGHRNLFRQSFDELQCHMYILKRLLYSHVPELAKHFNDINVEVQMFAPQWFLTLFSSKFPLGLVDLAMDMFLSQGKQSIICISIAMLKICQEDLVVLNFEHTMKYLCNTIPRRFASPSASKQLFQLSYNINFPPSSFEQLQIEFDGHKKELNSTMDPIELKRIENRILIDCQMRLEQENNILANDLIQTKIQFGEEILALKESKSLVEKKLQSVLTELEQSNNLVSVLQSQEELIKQEFRKLIEEQEASNVRKESIIGEYKKVCSTLEEREKESKGKYDQIHAHYKKLCENCLTCSSLLDSASIDDSNQYSNSVENLNDNNSEHIHKLEMDLAHTKMKLAESESENERLQRLVNDLQRVKTKKWFPI